MALSNSVPQPFNPGPALQDGSALNTQLANPTVSVTNNQTATGTTQATAVPITAQVTQFSNVAANTGGILTTLKPGSSAEVYNDGVSTLSVYPPVGSAIDGGANNAAVNLSAGNRAKYTCLALGVIKSALLGAVSS